MILKEENRDLFGVSEKYHLAHCISSDCAMGAGIAVQFNERFNLREKLLAKYDSNQRSFPTCILEGRVLNLITKERYWHKPTYGTLVTSLNKMREIVILNKIKYVAMPKIGCGLDGLKWGRVRKYIEATFGDLEVEILVCYL